MKIIILVTFFVFLFIALFIFMMLRYNNLFDKVIILETKIDDLENEHKKTINKSFWEKNILEK